MKTGPELKVSTRRRLHGVLGEKSGAHYPVRLLYTTGSRESSRVLTVQMPDRSDSFFRAITITKGTPNGIPDIILLYTIYSI